MKLVLISIQPQWVEKIASGKKTIEVRKTAPKKIPFKVYIYCPKDKYDWVFLYSVDSNRNGNAQSCHGKVIGEFICDYIQEITTETVSPEGVSCFFKDFYNIKKDDLKKIGLNHEELWNYGQGKPLYGWHIADLKIYGKPKGLASFIFLVISQAAKIVKNRFFMIVGAKKEE